jgi:small conductance mechanosensitive channel
MHSTAEKLLQAVQHMVDGFISRLPALLLGIAVFLIFYFVSGFVGRAIRRTVTKRRQNLALVFARLAGGCTILFGLLIAISIVAPSFQASDLIKILGIGGVAIGFAFQNILQNFLAGLLILWSQPFRIGDEIKLDPFEGRVEDIQPRATIVRTYDERRVVIPNADLFTRSVVVNTAFERRRWQYDITLRRSSNAEKMRETILDTLRRVPGVLKDPPAEILLTGLETELLKFRIFWSTQESKEHQMLTSYDHVLTAINDVLVDDKD